MFEKEIHFKSHFKYQIPGTCVHPYNRLELNFKIR